MIKIFLTIFFGILVGALIGRQLGTGWWSLTGGACGGIFAYFAYNLKVVINGIRLATKEIFPGLTRKTIGIIRLLIGFILRWVIVGLGHGLSLSIIVNAVVLFLFVEDHTNISFSLFAFTSFIGAAFVSLMFNLSSYSVYYSRGGAKEVDRDLKPVYHFYRYSPITIVFYWLPRLFLRSAPWLFLLCIWSLIGFVRVCKTSPATIKRALVLMGRWFAIFFRFIHSDARMICGAFAAMGAMAGSLVGDLVTVVLVALIGALLGAVEYYVISVRWLKLQPGTARA